MIYNFNCNNDCDSYPVINDNDILSINTEKMSQEEMDKLISAFESEASLVNANTSSPYYLESKTLTELYDTRFDDMPPIIDNFLYQGVYLFAGSPKVGKSFLMCQIAQHVSQGIDLWGNHTKKATALYLALEDGYSRIQKRMYRMFGEEDNDNLFFATKTNTLSGGLLNQLSGFIEEHINTKLIIIDTLKKIRDPKDDQYNYANDYELIASLKDFADKYKICILVVHHTRKETSDDIFDMISGTNGLLGAADGAFVLYKEKRMSEEAILDVVGKDQTDKRYKLVKDSSLYWKLKETESTIDNVPDDPTLIKIASMISKEKPMWKGTATVLSKEANISLKPNALSRLLNVNADILLSKYNIKYSTKRSNSGRWIELNFMQ